MTPVPLAELNPVAHFPAGYFLENLILRPDGSVLITAVLQNELWLVPQPDSNSDSGPGDGDVPTGRSDGPASAEDPRAPVLVHRFDHPITGIVEVEPDVFVINLTEAYTTHESHLARVDLNGWSPEQPVQPEIILSFDQRVRGLNGSCLLGPDVIAVADCFAGLIWRIDLEDHARTATARVWLAHDTMAMDADSEVEPPPQPGVNGVHYGTQSGYLYYTSTAQKVFMRVPVDPDSLDPAGAPEFVAAIDNADDFCIDESAGFAYVTRHRASTLDRVPLSPRRGSEVRHIAGDPFDPLLAGPSSMIWGPGETDTGRIAYVITDGGRTGLPPDGVPGQPTLLRLELTPEPPPLGGRLPLSDPAALNPAQRRLFASMTSTVLPWAQESGFLAAIPGRRLIGPFNPALLRPEITGPFLALQAQEGKHTSLDARTRQVVILTVGAAWDADYELYAHSAVARHAGLPEHVIKTLAAGETPRAGDSQHDGAEDAGFSKNELIAHQVARSLVTDRCLSNDLYANAEKAFSSAGVLDIVMLVGICQTVCGILSAFTIPAPS